MRTSPIPQGTTSKGRGPWKRTVLNICRMKGGSYTTEVGEHQKLEKDARFTSKRIAARQKFDAEEKRGRMKNTRKRYWNTD
ncbi:hypothetical protein CEXT_427771 [Caerostris extrusa]|uniref:Uncharacterized protein n=1 Tax=Caerostris extrusa TaxID=172846 RepID=A0AAV4NAF1_CAEEX|nr:hypothetical protein CEXT_427771 [Caerostris extrusa]